MKPSEYSIIPTEWVDKEMAIYVHCLNELESVPTEKRDELWSSMLSVNRHRVVLLQRIKEQLQPLLPLVEFSFKEGVDSANETAFIDEYPYGDSVKFINYHIEDLEKYKQRHLNREI